MDALASAAASLAPLAAHASPVLSSFFGAIATPDPRWIELATLVATLWHHASSRDQYHATTLRLGRAFGPGGRAVALMPVVVRVGGGCGRRRRRARRPVGVGRGR
jgi:hypothetical protein